MIQQVPAGRSPKRPLTTTSHTQEVIAPLSRSIDRKIRILHVEDNSVAAMCVDRYLRDQFPEGCEVEVVSNLEAAISSLEKQDYDAVLLDLGLPDSAGLATLKRVVACKKRAPILVLSGEENPLQVTEAIREGARAFLFKSRLDGAALVEALQRAVHLGKTASPAPATRPETDVPPADCTAERYPLAASAVVIPIESDGRPGTETVASVVELGRDGIAVIAETNQPIPTLCVVGVERPDGSFAYATVRWQPGNIPKTPLQLDGHFVSGHADPLDASKLVPRLNKTSLKLEPVIPESILRQWALIGVARPHLVDRVHACPSCQSIPTFRIGCSNCGSARTTSRRLIHHFTCAHVADASDFEDGDTLTCPKCHARNLVVGANFEHLNGPQNCPDCSTSGTKPILIGECLRCSSRFPGSKATVAEVIQYHVERLDPLALLETT